MTRQTESNQRRWSAVLKKRQGQITWGGKAAKDPHWVKPGPSLLCASAKLAAAPPSPLPPGSHLITGLDEEIGLPGEQATRASGQVVGVRPRALDSVDSGG